MQIWRPFFKNRRQNAEEVTEAYFEERARFQLTRPSTWSIFRNGLDIVEDLWDRIFGNRFIYQLTVPVRTNLRQGLELAKEASEKNVEDRTIYQFFAWLPGGKPECYRRFQMKKKSTFYELHLALQTCFGWRDSHLHHFQNFSNSPEFNEWVGYPIEGIYGEPFIHSGHPMLLENFLIEKHDLCHYYYQISQSAPYRVYVQLENILVDWRNSSRYPRCIDGQGPNPRRSIGNREYYQAYTVGEYGSPSAYIHFADDDDNSFDFRDVHFDPTDRREEWIRWSDALNYGGLVQINGRRSRTNVHVVRN
ncbi:hypothetical protein CHUAL_007256 [Chamberlinius hualienensis]